MSKILFGNAGEENPKRGGWFVGHFIAPPMDLRSTNAVEVKWGIHPAGEAKPGWTKAVEATTLAILIRGKFHFYFPDRDILLTRQGDYALWPPGVLHTWQAEQDSIILTIRWPSQSDDVVAADENQVRAMEKSKPKNTSNE